MNRFSIGDCDLGMLSHAIGYGFRSLSEPNPVFPLIIQHHTYDYNIQQCKKLGMLRSVSRLNLQ